MKKPYNVPLRVSHFNKGVWYEEDLIHFDSSLGDDIHDPHNYTTRLYKKAMKEGRVLEVKDGWYRLYKNNSKGKVIVQGQAFLHILFYLEYRDQRKANKWLAELNERENAEAELWSAEAELWSKEIEAMEEEEEEEEEAFLPTSAQQPAGASKKLEFEEREGVTFLKGTNFVISKIL